MGWLHLALDDISRWEAFWAGPERAAGPLVRRWLRARDAGAEAEGPAEPPIHTDSRLRMHQERAEPVLRALDEVLAPTAALFAARHFSLLFADADGVVVARHAGGGFAEHAHRLRLQPGAAWDEATRGTNAIGTALAEQRPVHVRGAAHLARPNHRLVCYAAPVHDPWGQLVGVLDATSMLEQANPLAGAAVLSAAKAVEEALRVSMLDGAGGTLVHRLLARMRDPAVLVGPDGRVHLANHAAVARGMPLGPAIGGSDGLVRVRARVEDCLGVGRADVAAAGAGQIQLPGLEVEPVETRDGRIISWMVLSSTPPQPTTPRSRRSDAFAALVGTDAALSAVRAHAARVGPSTLPVLILGETGTGKELLARGIHAASHRAAQPFIALNCAALTPSLLQSELFGYAPGAFTGAAASGRDGRIASADGGTLFLDELGEMPGPLQALLLRFLEDGSYFRVGEQSPRRADVRLVCATCRDLRSMVDAGQFRADLFYRIRGSILELPPVRARSDRPLLSRTLLAQLCQELGQRRVPELAPEALAAIDTAPWPGNTRELRMALHHALVVSEGAARIESWHLPLMRAGAPAPAPAVPAPSIRDAKVTALQRALAATQGNVSAAARKLGVARSTVYRLMQKHGLDFAGGDGAPTEG